MHEEGSIDLVDKQRENLPEQSGVFAYTYDPLNRLASVSRDNEPLRQYAYDPFGNRTVKVEQGKQTRYAYNAMNQMLSMLDEQDEERYQYDQRGNLTRVFHDDAVIKAFAFDATNRLTKTENYLDSKAATYQYNGLGQRVGQTVTTPSIQTPDPMREIHYTLDITRQFNNLLQQSDGKDVQSYIWDTNPVSVHGDGNTCYYLQDAQGSPMRLLDDAGKSASAFAYDEFGLPLLPAQEKNQPFGYTGYRYDEISGNYFAQAREYDPLAARFVSRDAEQFIHPANNNSLNLYAYCQGNPMRFVDPLGFDGEMPRPGPTPQATPSPTGSAIVGPCPTPIPDCASEPYEPTWFAEQLEAAADTFIGPITGFEQNNISRRSIGAQDINIINLVTLNQQQYKYTESLYTASRMATFYANTYYDESGNREKNSIGIRVIDAFNLELRNNGRLEVVIGTEHSAFGAGLTLDMASGELSGAAISEKRSGWLPNSTADITLSFAELATLIDLKNGITDVFTTGILSPLASGIADYYYGLKDTGYFDYIKDKYFPSNRKSKECDN